MSRELMDKAMPDLENDTSNYVLIGKAPFYLIYYKPTNELFISILNMDLHYKIQDYLLSQNVEIFEGGLSDFQEAYWEHGDSDDREF